MLKLKIVYKDPATLNPYANNSRTHSEDQIDELVELFREFGFIQAVGLAGDDILTGHGRTLAALKMGLKEIPTVDLSHLTAAQRKAYIIADNRVGEKSGWDLQKLAAEVDSLVNLDFDVSLLGFSDEEVNRLLKSEEPPLLPEDERVAGETKTKRSTAKAKLLHKCPECGHEFTAD